MPPIPSIRRLRRTFARTVTPSSVTCGLPWPAGPFGVSRLRECSGRTENNIDSCREQGMNPGHGWHESDQGPDRIPTRDDDLRLALEGRSHPGRIEFHVHINGVFSVCFHRSSIIIAMCHMKQSVKLQPLCESSKNAPYTKKMLYSVATAYWMRTQTKLITGVYVQSVQTSVARTRT